MIGAADELFYARGVQAVGMDAVRSGAGVSLKRIYRSSPRRTSSSSPCSTTDRPVWDAGLAVRVANGRRRAARAASSTIFDFLDGWFQEPEFRGCAFINTHGELGAELAQRSRTPSGEQKRLPEYVAHLVREAAARDWRRNSRSSPRARRRRRHLGNPEAARGPEAARPYWNDQPPDLSRV